MATETTRGTRPSLSALLLAVLLAVTAGLSVPAPTGERAGSGIAVSAGAVRHSSTATTADTSTRPPARVAHHAPVASQGRVLHPLLVIGVRAARAPPIGTA